MNEIGANVASHATTAAESVVDISIVVPVYNSEKTIGRLVEQMEAELEGKYRFNFVLVNDGSRDGSYEVCKSMALRNPRVRFLSLFKNFGQLNAVLAGFREADGNVVILMDDDLQNPPREVHKLLEGIRRGYDFVYGAPLDRPSQTLFRRSVSHLSSRSYEILFHKPKGLYASSYVAVRQDVIREIVKYDGPYPYIMGLMLRITTNGCNVPVEHCPRQQGKSGYNFRKLFMLWLRGVTNFSILPLRVSTMAGIFMAIVSFVFLAYLVVHKLLYPEHVLTGWSSTMALIGLMGGLQLMVLGIMGEYVGRSFLTLNRTPQAVVREKYNCRP